MIKDRFLPDKAIDLIDDAGALVKMQRGKADLPDEIMECEKRIKLIVHRMENAIANHEFEKARFYSEEERKERKTLDELRQKYNVQDPQASMVTREHVEEVLAALDGNAISGNQGRECVKSGRRNRATRSTEPPQGKKQNDKKSFITGLVSF